MARFARSSSILLVGIVLLAGCSDEPVVDTTIPQDLGPEAAVRTLLVDIQAGDFEKAAALTDSEQAGLLTLAEGGDATDVVEALEDGGEAVAANFWSGFAQTLEPGAEPENWPVDVGEEVTEGDLVLVPVEVVPPGGEPRVFYLRRNGIWKVDMMATFGPILAQRLTAPVETLLSSANANASTVLSMLVESVPSLRVAAAHTELSPDTHQSLLALIERITRAG
jgi:hypothetical protein